MNKILISIIAIFSVFCSGICFASETVSIPLSVPPDLIQEVCKAPVWTNVTAYWKGVTDKRSQPEIGTQTQKGKEPIPVVADPPLTQTFDSALKNLFETCGMKFANKKGSDTLILSAEIRDFFAGVEKKLVTGKSKATSSIAFLAQRGPQSSSVVVGYEMESKKMRSGNIKQLQKTLEELFAETLRQIPETQEMKDLK